MYNHVQRILKINITLCYAVLELQRTLFLFVLFDFVFGMSVFVFAFICVYLTDRKEVSLFRSRGSKTYL